MRVPNKKACQIIGWDRKTQGDELGGGHCEFAPQALQGMRTWDLDDMAAGLFYIDQRKAGLTVKLAGLAASRLRRGMCDFPKAHSLTVVTIENGSISIMPTDRLVEGGEFAPTGFVSGSYLATALTIEVRNLRARVQRALDADAAIIGGGDDA